eukprot:m.198589 g.198589  ORF g.198589 m.198589 type:complete len:231 (+) comp18376_c0_seq1:126-818(+)
MASRNPWDEEHLASALSLGSRDKVLALAQIAGHLTEQERAECFAADAASNGLDMPAVSVLGQLNRVSHMTTQIHELQLELLRKVKRLETADVTDPAAVAGKMGVMQSLAAHLSAIESSQRELILRLQRYHHRRSRAPVASPTTDMLDMHPTHHEKAARLFPAISACLSSLAEDTAHLEWARDVDLSDKSLSGGIVELQGRHEQLVKAYEALTHVRSTMQSRLEATQLAPS